MRKRRYRLNECDMSRDEYLFEDKITTLICTLCGGITKRERIVQIENQVCETYMGVSRNNEDIQTRDLR